VTGTQLDLFGQVEAREQRAADAEQERAAQLVAHARNRAAFVARATTYPDGSPVIWAAPYDTCGGQKPGDPPMKEGDEVPGWWCWLCGEVSSNEFMLQLNHGLYAQDPIWDQRTKCSYGRGALRAYSRESFELRGARG